MELNIFPQDGFTFDTHTEVQSRFIELIKTNGIN